MASDEDVNRFDAGLRRVNALGEAAAREELRKCCGASRWIEQMVARRPFASSAALFDAADAVWNALGADDWLEAFESHPRIGESKAAAAQSSTAQNWSKHEQSGTHSASDETRAALADANRAYDQKFGHIFIICATGKSAEQMLAAARARLQNDPATELRIAAEEQRKITRIRLEKLLQP